MRRPVLPMRRLWPDRGGAVLIETALVLPILLIMMVCLIDFSMALFKRLYTEQLAISGVQLAISGGIGPVSDTQIATQLASDSGLPSTAFTITHWTECNADGTKYTQGACPNTTDVRADFVKVTVSNSFRPIFTKGLFYLVTATNFSSSATGRTQ